MPITIRNDSLIYKYNYKMYINENNFYEFELIKL